MTVRGSMSFTPPRFVVVAANPLQRARAGTMSKVESVSQIAQLLSCRVREQRGWLFERCSKRCPKR